MPLNLYGKIQLEVDVETVTTIGQEVDVTVDMEKCNLGSSFRWMVSRFTLYFPYKEYCDSRILIAKRVVIEK